MAFVSILLRIVPRNCNLFDFVKIFVKILIELSDKIMTLFFSYMLRAKILVRGDNLDDIQFPHDSLDFRELSADFIQCNQGAFRTELFFMIRIYSFEQRFVQRKFSFRYKNYRKNFDKIWIKLYHLISCEKFKSIIWKLWNVNIL